MIQTVRNPAPADEIAEQLRRTSAGAGHDPRYFVGPRLRAPDIAEAHRLVTKVWPAAHQGGSINVWLWWREQDMRTNADLVAEAWPVRAPRGAPLEWWLRVLSPGPDVAVALDAPARPTDAPRMPRGGKRPGAGRPVKAPEDKGGALISFRVPEPVEQELMAMAEKGEQSPSLVARRLLLELVARRVRRP